MKLRPPVARSDHFPELIGNMVGEAITGRPHFAFEAWAAASRFEYPTVAAPFLAKCGSAAEAFFMRPFCYRPGVEFEEGLATDGTFDVNLQVRAANYWIDAVLSDSCSRLAIEIDGMAFHRQTKEQVAADYLRQRRILLKGYAVARFTAREAFSTPDECWRQLEAIMNSRRNV